MADFSVFFTFVAVLIVSALATESEEAIRAELSDPPYPEEPMDKRDQIQLRQQGSGSSNPGSCQCTCSCNSQPTSEYGLGPDCPNYYRNCGGLPSGRPRDCMEVYQKGNTRTGVYVIYPNGLQQGIYVRCDMDTAGGGWTVIQRRINGDVDFDRNWSDYKQGFGDLNGNFWVGNANIYAITSQGNYQLRLDMSLSDTNKTYATYSSFTVGDENSGYLLTVRGYNGTAGDSLSFHSGAKFTTKDRDNDSYDRNCAEVLTGGWWYKNCATANLNGLYGRGIVWLSSYLMKFTEMKVRMM